jgi:hypothetical protein
MLQGIFVKAKPMIDDVPAVTNPWTPPWSYNRRHWSDDSFSIGSSLVDCRLCVPDSKESVVFVAGCHITTNRLCEPQLHTKQVNGYNQVVKGETLHDVTSFRSIILAS